MANKTEPTNTTKNIGLRVKKSRKKIPLNGVDFAKIMEISPSQLSDWESGRTVFAAEQIYKLAKKLGVSPSWLLTGDGEMGRGERE